MRFNLRHLACCELPYSVCCCRQHPSGIEKGILKTEVTEGAAYINH